MHYLMDESLAQCRQEDLLREHLAYDLTRKMIKMNSKNKRITALRWLQTMYVRCIQAL